MDRVAALISETIHETTLTPHETTLRPHEATRDVLTLTHAFEQANPATLHVIIDPEFKGGGLKKKTLAAD